MKYYLALLIFIVTSVALCPLSNVLAKTPERGLNQLATGTVRLLQSAGLAEIKEAAALTEWVSHMDQQNLLSSDAAIVDFYKELGILLLAKNKATQEELDGIVRQARESGGLKIAGLNPIILGAGYLNLLVLKDVVSIDQAQKILDQAVVK